MISLEAARLIRESHTPEHQDGNGYNRCALCSYVRHPCETWELADDLVTLLEQGADRIRVGCPNCVDRAAAIPALRCMVCGTGFYDCEADRD